MAATGSGHEIIPVFALAGWCAAEALKNLSHKFGSKLAPGEAALLPSLAIENSSKKRVVTIFDSPNPKTFEDVRVLLDQLSPSDKYAVLTSDGYVTIDDKKVDSVNLEGHLLLHPRQSFCFVIPYEHPDGERPFGFRKPRIASFSGFDIDSVDVGAAFDRGRDTHPDAPAIWQTYLRS
jgi:hypothetical protein